MDNEIDVTDFELFDNPSKLPLEKLYLKIKTYNDSDEEVKALDKFWITNHVYPSYAALPNENGSDEETKLKWMERANNYIKALLFVKRLPFYKFWSYVLYEPAIPNMLYSYIKNAVPCYLPQPPDEKYAEIYNLVLSIYKRILTPVESDTEFLTRKQHGQLLSTQRVITNCVLLDLARVYGGMDHNISLQDMFQYAYETVPNISDRLNSVILCFTDVFEGIGTAAYESDALTETSLNRLVLLLYDTAFSVNMFMKLLPPFQGVCIAESFWFKLIHMYDNDIPILYRIMPMIYVDDDHPGYEHIENARVELLECFHRMFTYCLDHILQSQENLAEQNNWLEKYLNIIKIVIDQITFFTDFNSLFPMAQDIEIVRAICPNANKEMFTNILSSLSTLVETNARREVMEQLEQEVDDDEENGLDEATVPEQIILDSKVTELMDMFPHLGDGFLEQCLLAMDLDSERVTIAILEDNLPEELSSLDPTMIRIPPEELEPGPSIAEVYVGKKSTLPRNIHELLDDKTHVKEQKLRYQEYSVINDDLYNDDFDDSFNDGSACAPDTDDHEQIAKPKLHGSRFDDDDDDEDYNSEDPSSSLTPAVKDAFCVDPAVLRAQREARYEQKQSNRKTNKNRDVVGKAKGQGQDGNVLKNRDNKNTHKSQRGNHNRRAGAQWKRSKGMIPS